MRSTHLLTCNREEVRLHRPWPAWAVPAVWEVYLSLPQTLTRGFSGYNPLMPPCLESLTLSSLVPGVPLDKSVIILCPMLHYQRWKPKCIFSRGSSHAHTMKLSNLRELFSDMSIIKIIVTGTGVKAKLSWIN